MMDDLDCQSKLKQVRVDLLAILKEPDPAKRQQMTTALLDALARYERLIDGLVEVQRFHENNGGK